MLLAERRYREALSSENLQDIADEFLATADKRFFALGQDWIEKNVRMPTS